MIKLLKDLKYTPSCNQYTFLISELCLWHFIADSFNLCFCVPGNS
uniref:Uncharacterized protein n=1 Tax=Rhizophora mucronata TaxID=61149 RepID=A0A2P2N1L1_RHIMU